MIEDGDKIVHINVQLRYKNKSLKVVVSIFGTKLILGISMEKKHQSLLMQSLPITR